jgi:hypothetical protein
MLSPIASKIMRSPFGSSAGSGAVNEGSGAVFVLMGLSPPSVLNIGSSAGTIFFTGVPQLLQNLSLSSNGFPHSLQYMLASSIYFLIWFSSSSRV